MLNVTKINHFLGSQLQ